MREIGCRGASHAVTMTGELADCFDNRSDGVRKILEAIAPILGSPKIYTSVGDFLSVEHALESPLPVASANWHATARFVGKQASEALLVDIGSTTTDLTRVADGEVQAFGRDDHSRLAHDELVYTGVVRTPLMSLAARVRFEGRMVNVMAEHFATTADVYRLTGELPSDADQCETADGRGKTIVESARRIARVVGCDLDDAPIEGWCELASYFAEKQLRRITAACEAQLSRLEIDKAAPMVGAGSGDFIARKIAHRLGRPYRGFASLAPVNATPLNSQCASAFAVAWLFMQACRAL
jgi:probable H4MPT-linked C1 transfer pathway protein